MTTVSKYGVLCQNSILALLRYRLLKYKYNLSALLSFYLLLPQVVAVAVIAVVTAGEAVIIATVELITSIVNEE